MKKNTSIIRVFLQTILFILFIAWIMLSVLYIRLTGPPSTLNWIIMGSMLLDGLAFAVFALLLGKKKIILLILLIVFLLVNIVLTFTDQMGIYDWAVLVINLIALTLSVILLVIQRRSTLES